MHFLPFFAMERQLFLHHYLPALVFSVMVLSVSLDLLLQLLGCGRRSIVPVALAGLLLASAAQLFAYFGPVT